MASNCFSFLVMPNHLKENGNTMRTTRGNLGAAGHNIVRTILGCQESARDRSSRDKKNEFSRDNLDSLAIWKSETKRTYHKAAALLQRAKKPDMP